MCKTPNGDGGAWRGVSITEYRAAAAVMPESEEGWLVPTQTSGEGCDLTATSPPGTVENAYSSREPTGMQALNRSIHSASEAHNLLGSGSQTSGQQQRHSSVNGQMLCAAPVQQMMAAVEGLVLI